MSYFRYPSSSGVQTYPTFSAFPSTAADGTLALALDTDILYAFNIGANTWIVIGGPGSVLSIGTIDSVTASANGAVINITNQLIMQSASATVPGLVNTTAQTLAGAKTFSGGLLVNSITKVGGASTMLDVQNAKLQTTAGVQTLDWQNRYTSAADTSTSLDWENRRLYDSSNAIQLSWSTSGVNLPQLTASTLLALDASKNVVSQATGNLSDSGTDGIVVTGGTGAVIGSGVSIAQHVADASHNGYLSSTDWSTFNSKQSALTFGNLTEATSSVLTIAGGTGAVIGSGTSIQVKQATTSQSGYLSSTDWNTFNGKIDGPGTVTDKAIVSFNGTTGKSVQNNVTTIDPTSGGLTFNSSGAGANTALDQLVFNNASNQNPVIKSNTTGNQLGIRIFVGTHEILRLQDNDTVLAPKFQTLNGNMQLSDYYLGRASAGNYLLFSTTDYACSIQNLFSQSMSNAMLYIPTSTATSKALKLLGSTSQSANMLEVNNNSDVNLFAVGANGEFIANEQGAAVNCRIEGDTDANLLFTDGTNDRVGIGTNSPSVKLHVVGNARITGLSTAGVVTNDANGVLSSVAPGTSGNILTSNGSAWVSQVPSGPGLPTLQKFTSSSGTYTTPANCRYIKIKMVGGGGGGSGAGTSGGGSGSDGGDTTFGTLTAGKGFGGVYSSGGGAGGAGGTNSGSVTGTSLAGGNGQGAYTGNTGSMGGVSPFGGAGVGKDTNSGNNGVAAIANTGSGGGGGTSAGGGAGSGGGAGGYIEALITSPSATYSYSVGAGGGGGSAGSAGSAGGDGGSGVIIVEEYY